MKIVYIGAGSFRFSYQLFRNFAALAKDYSYELWLIDINAPLLDTMTKVLRRIIKKYHLDDNLVLHSSTDRTEALENADIVIVSISVGQQISELVDVHIPLKFGIPQTVGDTVGPGGIFRALRVVPVIQKIIKDVQEYCQHATVLCYTNPMTTSVYGALKSFPNIETLGICHELMRGMNTICNLLRREEKFDFHWEDFTLGYAGINHFSWLLSVEFNDRDLYPIIRNSNDKLKSFGANKLNFELLDAYSYFPYPGARHLVEFLPEQYLNYTNYKKTFRTYNRKLLKFIDFYTQIEGVPMLRNVQLLSRERNAVIWFFKQVARGIFPCPSPSVKGERALEMIIDKMSSIDGDKTERMHPINTKNTEIISNITSDTVVETSGSFKNGKIVPTKVGKLPEGIKELVSIHALNIPKIVKASLTGDTDKLLDTLLSDPMCKLITDSEKIEQMMWNMLYYEQKWLPLYKESIPTLDELEKLNYYISHNDIHSKRIKWVPDLKL